MGKPHGQIGWRFVRRMLFECGVVDPGVGGISFVFVVGHAGLLSLGDESGVSVPRSRLRNRENCANKLANISFAAGRLGVVLSNPVFCNVLLSYVVTRAVEVAGGAVAGVAVFRSSLKR